MLPYLEIHAENLILTLGFGLLGFFFLALALASDLFAVGPSHPPDRPPPDETFADGIREGHGKVPLVLVMLYAGLAVWAVLYVLAHGLWGMDFAG